MTTPLASERPPSCRSLLPTRRHLLTAAAAACAALMLGACGDSAGASSTAPGAATGASAPPTSQTAAVKIGYFPNLTHAPGLVADTEGFFTERIGTGKVTTQSFNAGPDVIQALFSGSLDIAYVGPNPTITAYAQSQGAAIRVIAGAASGGAALVVKPSITSPEQLKDATLATPQLGNTQDVALRYWLSTKGFKTTTEGGGDVKVQPQKNAAALQAYVSGQLDGAWVPEPYATQFVAGGAHVLVDERSLWPDGKFVTTNIVVRTQFLTEHPETVRAFLEADLDALDLIAKDPAKARQDVIDRIGKLTGQTLKADTVAAAWKNLTFTADPLAASLKQSAAHAATVGLLPNKPGDDFTQLWDLRVLNAALKARGESEVTS
jgi:NitT/TauT family transport system substrate-binding protein